MEERIQKLERELGQIKKRNSRVEADKAWEISSVRIFSITLVTYGVAAIVLYSIGVRNFWLSALMPAIGYFLSVQSLPALKRLWVQHFWLKRQK